MPPVNRDAVILYDAQGNEMSVIDGQPIAADTSFLILAGRSPTNAVRAIKVAEDGTVATSGGGGGSGGTSQVDKAPFLEGVSSFTPFGGVVNDLPPIDPIEDQAAAARITPKRAVHSNLRRNDGTEIGTASDPVRTDPTGTTTQPISAAALPLPAGAATEVTLASRASEATVASILAQLDVALSTRASQTTLLSILAQLDVALSTRAAAATQTDGTQKSIVRGGAKGATAATDVTSTAEGADHQAVDVQIYHGGVAKDPTQIRVLSSATDSVAAAGDTAHDAVDAGNPVKIGGKASAAAPAAVAIGDRVNGWFGLLGEFVTRLVDGSGDSLADDANNALRVNVVAGSAGGPSKIDDSAFAVGADSVAPMGALADDTAPDPVDEGDVGIPRMSLNRILYHQIRDGLGNERGAAVDAANALKTDSSHVTQPVSAASLPLPVGAATEATLATRLAEATFTARINTQGQKLMAGSTPVVLASDHSNVPTRETKPTTSTISRVASSAANVTLLAANANRVTVTIVNDSKKTLYVKEGTTATLIDFTYKLLGGATLELPYPVYPGQIDGIWDAVDGAAQITERTP